MSLIKIGVIVIVVFVSALVWAMVGVHPWDE